MVTHEQVLQIGFKHLLGRNYTFKNESTNVYIHIKNLGTEIESVYLFYNGSIDVLPFSNYLLNGNVTYERLERLVELFS